jgi:hypothetical protein
MLAPREVPRKRRQRGAHHHRRRSEGDKSEAEAQEREQGGLLLEPAVDSAVELVDQAECDRRQDDDYHEGDLE